jgi:transcriptional regulator with XRE-family HTH domain
MPQQSMRISPRQVRAARALLAWSVADLAAASGLDQSTVAAFEAGKAEDYGVTFQWLLRALAEAGIEFIPENGGGLGVRLRKQSTPQEGLRPEELNAANDD